MVIEQADTPASERRQESGPCRNVAHIGIACATDIEDRCVFGSSSLSGV